MTITDKELDFIKETLNIGVGKSARILNTMLSSHITLNIPEVWIPDNDEELRLYKDNPLLASVTLPFSGLINGDCRLIFPSDSALKLVNKVSDTRIETNEEGFDPISESILKEIGNIILNSVIGSLCNLLEMNLKYSVPTFSETRDDMLIGQALSDKDSEGLIAKIHFIIESMNIQGDCMTVFKMGSFSELLKKIDNYGKD